MKKHLEKQLMFCCATTHLDERKTDEVRRLLGEDMDWDYILAAPSFTSITPMLFYNLKKIADRNTIPQPVVDKLRLRYIDVLRRNTVIYRQLREILGELRNEGIPAILLKGVALAETVYPDIALRPMADIDFMVRKADLHSVMEIFTKLGYTQAIPNEYFDEHHHLSPYRKIETKQRDYFTIEVHHNIDPVMSGINVDRLWEGAQTVSIVGVDALVLSPENLILHLCVHLSGSCFLNGMRALVDISQSIRYYGRSLNWHLLTKRSKEFGVCRSVYYTLCLAKETMGINIPNYALDDLKLELKQRPLEAKLTEKIAAKNILKNWHYSSLPSRFIIFLDNSLCKALLRTSGIGNMVRSIGITWFRALDRAYHRHIKKDYKLEITRW
ncbi:nucleotidyltransferase family protein [Candidatus Poribacteria bacterium]